MSPFSPIELLNVLRTQPLLRAGGALCVAFSGGLDSTVLVHALARIVAEHSEYRLRAVHVDHQLHADSGRWREHCEEVGRSLGVEVIHQSVDVVRDGENGLEAAARQARYTALRRLVEPGEVLLTAHHADDQLETMLFALVRGAGARGLSAMQAIQSFGAGWLARPLLTFTRAELETWASQAGLRWIDDPSNQSTDFDRNYLRQRILPALRERWPAVAQSATRSAAHLNEAVAILDHVAQQDLARAGVGACLSVDALRSLAPDRRRNLLRFWIRDRGLLTPSTRKLATIEHDMLAAREDRIPCIDWDGAEVRRHRGLLYCGPKWPAVSPELIEWRTEQPMDLPAGLGQLRMTDAGTGGICLARLTQPLQIRFREGGESLRPAGDAHHRKLKKLLQSCGVLPWWRGRVPLIYCAGQLVAVGDLWITAEFAARAGEPSQKISWQGRPALLAVDADPTEKNS
jgi:tRNA(Ile)-lysidine synthase